MLIGAWPSQAECKAMQAIKREVVVQEGGRIEVVDPDLPVGARAEVIVLVVPVEREPVPLVSLIGAARGVYGSAEEADTFLSRERDAWDR